MHALRPLSCALLTACGGADFALDWAALPAESDGEVLLVPPNLDDDDGDGTPDWETPLRVDGEDDYATVTLSNRARPSLLRLDGAAEGVRVLHEGRLVLGPDLPPTWRVPERKRKEVLTLQVEVRTWGPTGRLVLVDERSGEERSLSVHGSPPTMGHHLLPTEHVYVVDLDFGDYDNASMLADLRRLLGERLTVAPGARYGSDPWMQDEPEFFGLWTPEAQGQMILDSVRDGNGLGGLDPFPESLIGSGVSVQARGNPTFASTFDAFGNLEVSPPVTVDGTRYPLGRIYYGWDGISEDSGYEYGPQEVVRDFLDELQVQAPFAVDTSWLCVGHIDEFTTFVPDPAAPRGFRFLLADTALGLQTLQQLPDATRLGRHADPYPWGHGRPTIGSYTQDAALIAYNQDLQRDHIEPALQVFRRELALTDQEIVRVPAFFEEEVDDLGVCGALAVIPGNVNLLMVTDEDGQGGLAILPDPFVRPDGAPLDDDPYVRAWRELLPEGVQAEFVDNWDVYHMGGGEVHCATNQERAPALSRTDLAAWLALEVTP